MRLQGLTTLDEPQRGGRTSPFKHNGTADGADAGLSSSIGLGRGGFTAPPLPGLARKTESKGAHRNQNDGFRSALVAIMKQAETRPRSGELPPLERAADEKDAASYNFYISNGIDTDHIAPMEEAWLEHILLLLDDQLKKGMQPTIDQLCDETREDYMVSVKKAIVDFVLGGNGGPAVSTLPADLCVVPLPWAAACAAARAHLQRTLHICSPAFLAVLGAWATRAPLRLVRTADLSNRAGPVELSVFCKIVAAHCDDVQTMLQKARRPILLASTRIYPPARLYVCLTAIPRPD